MRKKRSKVEKKRKRPSKKQKRERLKATQGSLCDQEKLGKKRSGGRLVASSSLQKKQKGCRKGIPSFRSFRLSRARSPCNRVRSFPKLPKSARFSASRPFSSPNKPRSPRVYRASGCVLVYLYVQPHIGRGFGRTSRLCKRLCTRLLICSTAHRPRFGRTSAVRSTVHSPCVRPRFSCVSRPCVIRAFRCAPNHTARPRNRPQLRQKVRSPGR